MLVKDHTIGISMRMVRQYDPAADRTAAPSMQDRAWMLACADLRPISFIDKLADALEYMAQLSNQG